MKLIVLVMLLLISYVVPAQAVNQYEVVNVNATRSFLNAGTKYLPATVKGTSGAISALKTAQLAISSTRGGNIAAAIAFAGLAYGADKFFDWLDKEGFPLDPETKIPRKQQPGEPYPTPQTKEKGNVPDGADWEEKPEPNPPVVDFSCESGTPTYTQWGNHQSFTDSVSGQLIMVVKASALCMGCCAVPEHDKYSAYVMADPEAPLPESVGGMGEPQWVPAVPEDIQTKVKEKMETGGSETDIALTDMLNRVNQSLKDLNDTLRGSPYWQNIKDNLNDSIGEQTKTDLDTKLEEPNAEDNYAEDSYNPKYGYPTGGSTKGEIQEAVKKAIDDETGVNPPTDPNIQLPEKKSLTTVMTSFMQSLESLPIVNTLNGITVNCSGSSVICLDLPSEYGGSYCYDCAPLSGSFNAIGTAMLSIITILCFIYLFKG